MRIQNNKSSKDISENTSGLVETLSSTKWMQTTLRVPRFSLEVTAFTMIKDKSLVMFALSSWNKDFCLLNQNVPLTLWCPYCMQILEQTIEQFQNYEKTWYKRDALTTTKNNQDTQQGPKIRSYINGRRIYGGGCTPPPLQSFLISDFFL